MSILKSDIKLMASERLTDFDDGGGSMTGNEVVSGELNNLFPDISRLDRVYGRVSLRKCFPAVMTDNQDMYYGSHAIVTDPPEDDNVYVTLFTTDDFDDVRADAQDRMESYVTIGGQMIMRPLNDQLEGQRAITTYQPLGGTYPEVGETIALKDKSDGDTQYVRITGIEVVEQEFVDNNLGVFTVDVVTLDLSAPLSRTFQGYEATPTTESSPTGIHTTVVADASNYYGVSKINKAVTQGDTSFWVDTIYNQLVPTSQIESPIVDQIMGGGVVTMYQNGADNSMTFSGTRSDATSIIHLPNGILPGTLNITIGGYEFIDNSARLEAVNTDGGYEGFVDYSSGQITISKDSWSASITLTATPAFPVNESPITREIFVELENRSYNYTPNLQPLPKPGSIYIDYMAQGKWYRIVDDGRGLLAGEQENTGTGTIDYASGSMVVTLGALPDVESSIIFGWGSGVTVDNHTGTVDGDKMAIEHTLGFEGVKLGSLSITWDDGGTKTATDNSQGKITGDATGFIAYGSGKIIFYPNTVPPSGTQYTIDYEQETPDEYVELSPVFTDKVVEFTIPNAPLRPGSISIDYQAKHVYYTSTRGYEKINTRDRSVSDNALGNMIIDDGKGNTTIVGTIDYTTGVVSFTALKEYQHTQQYVSSVNFTSRTSSSSSGNIGVAYEMMRRP